MAFFHCIDIDGVNVALKIDAIDPVTPISQADFVTGDITDPLVGKQKVFVYKYTGTASNGSTDGTMVGVDNNLISFKAQILMSTESISLSKLPGLQTPATTTDNTPKVINVLPIRENVSVFINIVFHAVQTNGGSEESAYWHYNYIFKRITGGSLVLEDELTVAINSPGGTNAILKVNGNYIEAEVSGNASENWKWSIPIVDISILEIS